MPVTADRVRIAGLEISRHMEAAGMTTGETLLCLFGVMARALMDETDDRTQQTIAA